LFDLLSIHRSESLCELVIHRRKELTSFMALGRTPYEKSAFATNKTMYYYY
jgi:hypothetical protein